MKVFSRIFCAFTLSILTLVLTTGCFSNPVALTPKGTASLAIRNVEPLGQTGRYLVSGEAKSLSGATVTLSAIRHFTADDSPESPNYSLLDRQFAPVSDGAWQTTLQIWQSDGLAAPQEPWQLDQAVLGMALTPASGVEFTATLDPVEARKWPRAIAKAEASSAVQYTADGDVYLAARSTINIPVPASLSAEAIESATGARRVSDRKAVTVNPSRSAASDIGQSPAASRTTVPINPSQYLR